MVEVFDQALGVVGVRGESMLVLRRAVELAPRKTATIVGDHGVVLGQVFGHPSEHVSVAISPRDHQQERATPADLVVEPRTGNLKKTHMLRLLPHRRPSWWWVCQNGSSRSSSPGSSPARI